MKLVVDVKRVSFGCLALGVEYEQLIGHVLHGLLHAGARLGPLLRTELVQHRLWAGVCRAIFLDQIEARERHIEPRLLGELQHHELNGEAILLYLFEADIATDAVLDMNYIVADGEIAEVGDECRGLGLARLETRCYVGFVAEIVGAKENEVAVGDADSGSDLRTHDDGYAHVSGQVAGLVVEVLAANVRVAAAEAIRQLILTQNCGQSLYFRLIGSGE